MHQMDKVLMVVLEKLIQSQTELHQFITLVVAVVHLTNQEVLVQMVQVDKVGELQVDTEPLMEVLQVLQHNVVLLIKVEAAVALSIKKIKAVMQV
jgi:hypothetical protein